MRVPVAVFTSLVVACASRSPAPPPPPDSVARLVAALEAYADRACACADRACTDALDAEAEATFAATPPLPLLRDAAFPRADAAIQRGIRCAWAHHTVAYAYGALALTLSRSARDDVCGCPDDACAAALVQAMRVTMLHAIAVPTREELRPAFAADAAARDACRWAESDRAVQPALDELAALRDRGCACADVTCTGAVQADFEAWMERHRDDHGSPAAADKARVIATDLGACFAAATSRGAR